MVESWVSVLWQRRPGGLIAAGQCVHTASVLPIFGMICLLLLATPGWAAGIKVYPDRATPALNQSFRLTFEADETVAGDPDFSPLSADFEILGQIPRSSIIFGNGRMRKVKIWILNLVAKRAGKLTIPPISFGSSLSEAFDIEVKAGSGQAAAAGAQIFLEVEVSTRNPYVQQQVLYTVRLYRDSELELSEASLGEPKLSNGGSAIVQQLGKDRVYHTRRDEAQLLVIERTYALFPQQSGATEIEPVMFQGQVVRGTASLFDPFAQNIETKRLQTERIALQVKSIPKAFTGKQWLPAKELRVTEIWSLDPPTFKIDEPLTRTRTLVASGLTAGQLPELAEGGFTPFKSYPDRAVLDDQKKSTGVAGIREEKVVLIAPHPGEYVLPGLTIPWWNTETDREEQVHLPERKFTLAPAPGKAAASGPQATAPLAVTSAPQAPLPVAPQPGPAISSAWPWREISLALGLGWLLTLAAWWRQRREPGFDLKLQIQATETATLKRSLQAVLDAARANNAQATKDSLLVWGKLRWPDQPPGNLGTLLQRCDVGLARELELLNTALYRGPDRNVTWSNGAELAAALQNFATQRPGKTPAPSALEPLFRSSGQQ